MQCDFTNNTISDFKRFFGSDRDVYPEWYLSYLIAPWVEFNVPEITWQADEIVENQYLRKMILSKFKIESDILVIGANRSGRQAYILSGDHRNIYFLDIINMNNDGCHSYGNCVVSDMPVVVDWEIFKNDVLNRQPPTRDDLRNKSDPWWKIW